ncbi:MAG: DUF167 domain-containing protein [Deltaproteobacteria bacterium]|nr:DUF167 domain-containing protein [Deltaproteobacteria bacterium]
MRITITVKPNARHEVVTVLSDGSLRVAVKAPATEGRANEAVVALLAQHFRVPKSSVLIVHGATGRRKLIEIKA